MNPSVDGSFGSIGVSIKDMSVRGARFKHEVPIEAGSKSVLRFRRAENSSPVALEALVIWTQATTAPEESGRYVSGAKLFADSEMVGRVIDGFVENEKSQKVDELRGSDRFILNQPLRGEYGSYGFVRIENLSSRGMRIETARPLAPGSRAFLSFPLPETELDVSVEAEVVWSHLKAVWSEDENRYYAGLRVLQRHELLRLAAGRLSDVGLAVKDTRSLKLKHRLERALLHPPDEKLHVRDDAGRQIGVLHAVRKELRLNPEGSVVWFQRAMRTSGSPMARGLAGPISDDQEALAVWEYVDRTIDPSLVALAFRAE